MSLKSIVYRGGRYARRRDRNRYESTPVSGPVAPPQPTDGCMDVAVTPIHVSQIVRGQRGLTAETSNALHYIAS